MTLLVPNEGEVKTLQLLLASNLTFKLFSNDIVPAETNTAASYTEVVGGGYIAKILLGGSWTIHEGAPSYGIYAAQDYNFTGVTNAPGTIYGYFIVDAEGICRWAERFNAAVLPFSPINGSLIRIIPRFEAS